MLILLLLCPFSCILHRSVIFHHHLTAIKMSNHYSGYYLSCVEHLFLTKRFVTKYILKTYSKVQVTKLICTL